MMKNGLQSTISTKHQCITLMKEYDKKSLEVSREYREIARAQPRILKGRGRMVESRHRLSDFDNFK